MRQDPVGSPYEPQDAKLTALEQSGTASFQRFLECSSRAATRTQISQVLDRRRSLTRVTRSGSAGATPPLGPRRRGPPGRDDNHTKPLRTEIAPWIQWPRGTALAPTDTKQVPLAPVDSDDNPSSSVTRSVTAKTRLARRVRRGSRPSRLRRPAIRCSSAIRPGPHLESAGLESRHSSGPHGADLSKCCEAIRVRFARH